MTCCIELHDADAIGPFAESCGEQGTLCKVTGLVVLPRPVALCDFHRFVMEEMGFAVTPLPDARQMELVN